MKKKFAKEATWGIAMLTNSMAISLLVKSSFGVSTLSSLPLVLDAFFPKITFGMMNFTIQALLLVYVIFRTKQPKLTYLLSFAIAFIFGLLVDLADTITAPWPNTLPLRFLYFGTGWLLIAFGASLFICSDLPLMPFDCSVKDLSLYTGKSVKTVKTSLDAVFVTTSLLLSFIGLHKLYGVGIGTVVMMFFTGTLQQLFIDHLHRKYAFTAVTKTGAKLTEIAAVKPARYDSIKSKGEKE